MSKRGAYSMNERGGFMHAYTHRHTLPPTHVQKNVNEIVGVEDGTASSHPASLISTVPPPPFLRLELSTYVFPWSDCPHNIHRHSCCCPSHACCLLILPLTLPAWIHTPLQTPHAHVAGGWSLVGGNPPPHPQGCRSLNERLQSEWEKLSTLALGNKGSLMGGQSKHCLSVTDGLIGRCCLK